MLCPVPRGYVEAVEPELRRLEDAPEERAVYAQRRGWQKNYFQGRHLDGSPGNVEHQTKLVVLSYSTIFQ